MLFIYVTLIPLQVKRLYKVVKHLFLLVSVWVSVVQGEDLPLCEQALLGFNLGELLVLVYGVLPLVRIVEAKDGGVII